MKKKICTYLRKSGQTAELARDDWLESLLAEESERNRCGESFLTPTVTLGHVSLKKHTKYFYCYVLFLILLKPTMNIHKSGHSFSKV